MDTKSFLIGAGLGVVALIVDHVMLYKLGVEHGNTMYAQGLSDGHKLCKMGNKTKEK